MRAQDYLLLVPNIPGIFAEAQADLMGVHTETQSQHHVLISDLYADLASDLRSLKPIYSLENLERRIRPYYKTFFIF